MGKKKNDIKIIDICGRACKVHPSFTSKMTKQLVESGTELLQEDIKNCVCVFLLDDDSKVKFDADGNGYINGYIINWKNCGSEATVKWSSPTQKNIYPDQDVEELDIIFRWCEDFPIEDLKMNSKKKSKRVDSKTYSFKVEYQGCLSPDIFLGITVNKPENDNCNKLLIDALVQAFENWNKNAEKTGKECIRVEFSLKIIT